MMCFYDPAKFSPCVVYRVEEGATLVPGRVIYLRAEPDLDDLVGMDDPDPHYRERREFQDMVRRAFVPLRLDPNLGLVPR